MPLTDSYANDEVVHSALTTVSGVLLGVTQSVDGNFRLTTESSITDGSGRVTSVIQDTTNPAVNRLQVESALKPDSVVNIGEWLSSSAPTVGQKPMSASLPITLASDQPAVPIGARARTSFIPDPTFVIDGDQPLRSDAYAALVTRGQVLTDEGSFRDDFSGNSLITTLTGTLSFTNGLTAVTGVGTAFTTELNIQKHIKLSSDANSALTQIAEIIDDTTLELGEPYPGATAVGPGDCSFWRLSTAVSGAMFSVTQSTLTITAATGSGNMISISRAADYLPMVAVSTLDISQRVANQNIIIGLQDIIGELHQADAFFDFSGTDATKVICHSSFAADSSESTIVSLPASISSSQQAVYRIDLSADQVLFSINSIQVAIHSTHLPEPYTILQLVSRIENTGPVSSSTSLNIDSTLFFNKDALSINDPINVQGVAGGQPVIIQFGSPGGAAALPKMVDLFYNQSNGAILANAWKKVIRYTCPVGYTGYLIKFTSFQDEAALSRVVSELNLGSHNINTNVFTMGFSYGAPQFSMAMQAEVTTQLASGAGSVVITVTYTNENGVGGRTGTFTISKGSAVGSRWDFTPQTGDLGVRSVQNCSASPTQVGVISILGFIQLALHNDQSSVASSETLYAPGATTFPADTVINIEYNGGTVSKRRLLDALVQLVQ